MKRRTEKIITGKDKKKNTVNSNRMIRRWQTGKREGRKSKNQKQRKNKKKEAR